MSGQPTPEAARAEALRQYEYWFAVVDSKLGNGSATYIISLIEAWRKLRERA